MQGEFSGGVRQSHTPDRHVSGRIPEHSSMAGGW
jgi:hypothetical protein